MEVRAAARLVESAIDRACRGAAVGLGIAVFILMFAGIAGRHVFSDGLPAVTELPEQLFPWWVMVSVVLAARAGAHVAVEALTLVLAPAVRRALSLVAHALTAIMSAGVVWTIAQVAMIAGLDRSPILGMPVIHLHAALALGFALLGVLSVCAALQVSEEMS